MNVILSLINYYSNFRLKIWKKAFFAEISGLFTELFVKNWLKIIYSWHTHRNWSKNLKKSLNISHYFQSFQWKTWKKAYFAETFGITSRIFSKKLERKYIFLKFWYLLRSCYSSIFFFDILRSWKYWNSVKIRIFK
jgi:hypothetical protein